MTGNTKSAMLMADKIININDNKESKKWDLQQVDAVI